MRFTKLHQWVDEVEPGIFRVGLSSFAIKELDNMPEVARSIIFFETNTVSIKFQSLPAIPSALLRRN